VLHDQVLLLPPEALLFALPSSFAAVQQGWIYRVTLRRGVDSLETAHVAVRRVAITLFLRVSKLRLMIKVTPVRRQSSCDVSR